MADTAVAPAPKRRSWVRIIGIALGVLLLLLIAAYSIITSSGFIKSTILPKVGKSIGAEITVSDISLSPFKQVTLKDLKVQPPGRPPVFTSPEVHVEYRLMDILRGNYVVDVITVKSPVIALVERADQTSNLDPIMEALGEEEEDEPMQLDLKKVVITDGTIRYVKEPSAEGSYSSEISNLNVDITGLKTDEVGKISFGGNLQMQSAEYASGTNSTLAGTLKGALGVSLTPMLMPSLLKGDTRLEISQGTGDYARATGLAVTFDADVTATEVKQLAVRLLKNEQALGEFAASGPFSIEKMEGTLDVRLSDIDRNALSLAAAGSGMDFGKTAINSTNRIQATKGGQHFAIAGEFLVNNLQVTRTNQSTPVLNLQSAYDVTLDQAKSNLVVRALSLNGTQSGREFLKAGMTAPMIIDWGKSDSAVGDSAFNLTVTDFNLAEWKAFLGDAISGGIVNANVNVQAKGAGKLIEFAHRTEVQNLDLMLGSNRVSGVGIRLAGDGSMADTRKLVTKYSFELRDANGNPLQVTGNGQYDTEAQAGRGDAKGTARLPELLRMGGVQDAALQSGQAQFNAVVQVQGENQQVQGEFNLQNLTGSIGSNVFQNFAAAAKVDAALSPEKMELRKATVNLSQAGKEGGSAEVSGTYGLSNQVAQMKAALKDLNQNVLGTFLQPMLGEKALASISINGQTTVNYDPEKPSLIAADFKVSNLVVKDPTRAVAPKPLEASFAFETTIDKDVAEIRKGLLSLTPTERAKNQVQLAGRVDTSNTNFTSGTLKLSAESMDVTTYYDLFDVETPEETAQTTGTSPAPQRTPGGTGTSKPDQEAEPMVLPLSNFVAEVNIGRFFLRELEITNLVVNTRVDGGRVQLNPVQMAINGAPLKSSINLDLSVPGYRYDVSFGMTQVPFAPLVNTFTPERKGQLSGTLTANAQVKGQGTTGASLQKNLNGSFYVGTTNLDLQISNMRSPMLKTIVNVIAIVPTIVKNPSSGLTSLAGALLGGSGRGAQPTGDWADELTKSPIDIIQANGDVRAGTVNLEQAFVQSRAFQAEARGTVELAKVLTNSTVNIPLNVAIRRSLAETINLVPPNTPTNATYVRLPDYVAVKGTIGEPKADINKRALLGTVLQQYGGSLGLDKKSGNIVQGLGGLLTGQRPAATNAPAGTNAVPQTNAPGGLLQGLGGLLGRPQTQTNAPAPATNTPSSQIQTNPVGTLIEGLFGRPKKN